MNLALCVGLCEGWKRCVYKPYFVGIRKEETSVPIGEGSLCMVGSAWSMAISGIAYDNALMRELSLEDLYFALTDSLDYQFAHKRSMIGEYEIERHE